MTRARILADYVSGGTTAAEFDYLDGVTSNIQTQFTAKAPIAGPTFTGTVAIPNVANLETAVVANTAKVTGSTSASDLASGTLATARMAAGTIIKSEMVSSGSSNTKTTSAILDSDGNRTVSTGAYSSTCPAGSTSVFATYTFQGLTSHNTASDQNRRLDVRAYYHTSDVAAGTESGDSTWGNAAWGTALYETDGYINSEVRLTGEANASSWWVTPYQSNTYEITGLSASTTYYYHMLAYSNTGCRSVELKFANIILHYIKS